MARTREILTVVGTLACAAGIGFVMQNSEVAEKRDGKTAYEREAITGAKVGDAIRDVQEVKLTSAEIAATPKLPEPDAEVTTASAPQSQLSEPDVPALAQTADPVTPACEITATARPVAAAMVDLRMDAACLPESLPTSEAGPCWWYSTTPDVPRVPMTP